MDMEVEPPKPTTQHPLEMPVVVKVLLKYIPRDFSSLSTFRLVSQSWRAVSQDTWNHLYGTLTLYDNPDHPFYQDKGGILLSHFYERYTDKTDSLFKYPFQKYELRFWKLQPCHFKSSQAGDVSSGGNKQLDLKVWFWTTIASHIKKLTLIHCNSPSAVMPCHKQFLRILPNLNELKIAAGCYLCPTYVKWKLEDR